MTLDEAMVSQDMKPKAQLTKKKKKRERKKVTPIQIKNIWGTP